MRTLLSLVFLTPVLARADLVITEIMCSSSHSDGTRNGDWWELTNTGASAVSLANYSWDDDPPVAGTVKFNAGITIQAGESIIILDEVDATSFKAAWGLTGTNPATSQPYQVLTRANFSTASFPGLGASGQDGIYLYNPSNVLADSAVYTTVSVSGFSRAWFTNNVAVAGEYSVAGLYGAAASTDATPDVASPGTAVAQPPNTPPVFVGDARTFWPIAWNLLNSTFRIQAQDTVGQTVTYSIVSNPSNLSIIADGTTKMKLSGLPPSAGDHTFTIRASDGSLTTDQTFTLTVYPASVPVVVNEYNAVSGSNIGSDSYFGAIAGNGGDWFELAVVGAGNAASTVDLRGWKIDITAGGSTNTIVLSNDSYWSAVPAGTILTFSEDNTAGGGLDTGINRVSQRNTTGHLWSNIWLHDPFFINQADSTFGGGITIDNNNTWITIRDSAGTIVSGPCGEGIASRDTDFNGYPDTLVGVSGSEVLALGSSPSPSVHPLTTTYHGESTSTFGSPNVTTVGNQSFAAFSTTNTPPRITSTPVRYATGSYSYTVTAIDPNGGSPSINVPGLPSFLSLSGSTISNNRPLVLADAGEYVIRVEASDGTYTTPQVFLLTVFNPSPTVILNEYNAVDSTAPVGTFLNGGTDTLDSDGAPNAVDKHFGRVEGNGGDWFELVVVGTGAAGTVDMRGWKIEIGQHDGPIFETSAMIQLSTHNYWSAVPTGTILTFIEHNTAQGGLDTGIAIRNRRSTDGDTWTNIWIGDSTYLTYTDAVTNGYTVTAGVVTGVAVDDLGTRLRIKDAGGRIVFGAAGEGISPVSGVNDKEVFELQANPLPSISPLSTAYLDAAAGSSFGWPNEWSVNTQSFAPYVYTPTPYESWIGGYAVADASPGADPDGDGRSNREEYAFGGNPGIADGPAGGQTVANAGGTATWQYARRSGDASLVFSHQRSVDLANWQTLVPVSVTTAPHPTLSGFETVTVTATAASVSGKEFFRAALAP